MAWISAAMIVGFSLYNPASLSDGQFSQKRLINNAELKGVQRLSENIGTWINFSPLYVLSFIY